MKTFSMLILTDHSQHSNQNALYALARALKVNPACTRLDIASRGLQANQQFFFEQDPHTLWATSVGEDFRYTSSGYHLRRGLRQVHIADYEVLFLRLPYPVEASFWNFLNDQFPQTTIINHPLGIERTSNKFFLTSVSDLCPPIQICRNKEDILQLYERFPIVLKPARNYGGKGIVKIENDTATLAGEEIPLDSFIQHLASSKIEYLGMQYLRNVSQGDKRIIVIDGKVVGASLRMPAPNSWLCNVSQGGTSVKAEADADELYMAERLSNELETHGIVFFGFDTLVNNEGNRVLSEINTMSIGGLPQIELQTGRPVVREAADLLCNYINRTVYGTQSFAA